MAETRQTTRLVDDAEPSVFIPGTSPRSFAWSPDENSRDFLGNEYLLWLWYQLDAESDTIKLGDDSTVAVLLSHSLALECPRGQTGRESISSDAPTQLPEARRAVQAGKMPRKMGMTISRHDQQYEFTLQAETLAVSGAKFPAAEALEERARLEERVNQLRQFLETLDLLYDAFAAKRASEAWSRELARMQKWLRRGEVESDESKLA